MKNASSSSKGNGTTRACAASSAGSNGRNTAFIRRVFLSRYRGYLACPDCAGARLRREARDVRVGGRTIDAVSALTVKQAQQFFAQLELSEKKRLSPRRCCAKSSGACS